MILKTTVPAYEKGFLFKNGKFIKLLDEGEYYFLPGDKVLLYSMDQPFIPPVNLNILLADAKTAAALEVVEVALGEIVLVFERGMFTKVLPPGRYAFFKGLLDYSFIRIDTSSTEPIEGIDKNILASNEMAPYVRMYTVDSFEKGLLFREGKFVRELSPGVYLFFKNTTVLTVYKVDTRQLQLEMNGQEILTKDKAALRINFYVQYRVIDVFRASDNKEYEKQLYVLMQLALREQIGIYTLDELMEKRDTISPQILQEISTKTSVLGVEVTGCGIRDIILPGDVREIMNQVLIADKKAQANTIMRREETASTRSLLNTAKLMEENEMLYKLKEMEYVEKIADKINTLSVSGNGDLVSQLKQIFVPGRT